MFTTELEPRRVALVASAHKAEPAPGLIVDRPLPGPEVDYVSPFLMIDHFGPTPVAAGSSGGLNPHPHRGFETVTLLLDGAMEHHDSLGNHGFLRPGDVQWMTAARGIVHAEYHEREFAERGGTLEGIQLWVNLPKSAKMNPPGYQDLSADRITEVPIAGGVARIIAGRFEGARGPARTHTPMLVMHLKLTGAGSASIDVPDAWNALVYTIRGRAQTSGNDLRERQMAVFDEHGGALNISTPGAADVLVLAGARIDEPVVSWGPFVMNTREEILQARDDYMQGRMGVLAQR
ncbi:MAG: pirin family protein [Betaproteobacteria bacterium]